MPLRPRSLVQPKLTCRLTPFGTQPPSRLLWKTEFTDVGENGSEPVMQGDTGSKEQKGVEIGHGCWGRGRDPRAVKPGGKGNAFRCAGRVGLRPCIRVKAELTVTLAPRPPIHGSRTFGKSQRMLGAHQTQPISEKEQDNWNMHRCENQRIVRSPARFDAGRIVQGSVQSLRHPKSMVP
eukprot:scaffold287_cov337-Pavlova_lutheri.AAC.188